MSNNKVTTALVIPTYSVSRRLINMAYECARSHREQVDQIIISEDGGHYSHKLKNIADVYVYSHQNIGFTKNVNRGWGLSESDFTIIANSDTFLVSGNLCDLTESENVVCPEIINPDFKTLFSGSYFVVPKTIREKYGMLDERLKNYCSDDDYCARIKKLFRHEPRVVIFHHKGTTVKDAKWNVPVEYRRDSEIYKQIIEKEHPERKTW